MPCATCRKKPKPEADYMSSGFAKAATIALAFLLLGCQREIRYFTGHPASAPPGDVYQKDAYDVAQGKQLFYWMNCSGCHSNGGGGIGPALSDRHWIYGGKLQQIYFTIRDGRRNGMAGWGGRP